MVILFRVLVTLHGVLNPPYTGNSSEWWLLFIFNSAPSVKDGLSPAHKLFGRPIQDTLPAHTSSFTLITQLQQDQARAKAGKVRQQATNYYNRNTFPLYQTYGYSPK